MNMGLFAGGIGIAALAGFWNQLREFVTKLRSLLIGNLVFQDYQIYTLKWLMSKKAFVIGDMRFLISQRMDRNIMEISRLYQDNLSNNLRIIFTPFPVLISITKNGLKLTYLKYITNSLNLAKEIYTFIVEQMKAERLNWNQDLENEYDYRLCIGSLGEGMIANSQVTNTGYDKSPIGNPGSKGDDSNNYIDPYILWDVSKPIYETVIDKGEVLKDPFDDLYFDNEIMEIENRLKTWKSMRQWYKDRNIPWKMGFCFLGNAGTGKTSFIRALAQKYGIKIFAFQLGTFRDGEFPKKFIEELKCVDREKPKIILFEDIDSYFKNRINDKNGQNMMGVPLMFHTFLNVIDGIQELEGAILIATANHIEDIDPAILRPFRFGIPIHFGNIPLLGKEKIAKHILRDWKDLQQKAIAHSEMTGAEFKDMCLTMAFERIELEQNTKLLKSV